MTINPVKIFYQTKKRGHYWNIIARTAKQVLLEQNNEGRETQVLLEQNGAGSEK